MPSRSVLPLLFLSLASAAAQNPDPYAKSGNPAPQATPLAAEQETALLKDVKVADGFDVTLFAAPPMVNYPVFVTAAPDGTLYVSSDGNGSLGRDPGRGRVIRLRDTDGDGHADETRVFCEVDAPRGLVWDRDRLYLVHPPHLSEYIDADGDGVAEKENILVKNIAFGYEDRPADHTTNGLTLGIDGWLYIAGGDFGFMDAEGSDGRHLQHRGGGVIRVRPDGTGLELFCTGTRNILEVAISPTMDVFARDNTNDGGGWNVRFHHLLPLTNQGYPRLFKNFPNECIQPLADYGGGSGCGAVFIDEPGFGEWNHAPFTCDWGTGALWHHQVRPKGATFEETRDPLPLVRMTRPTDADVDAMGHLYVASWKGATFKWEGPDVGYIVRVTPKGSSAEALPDFDSLKDSELRGQLQSPSFRRRLAAMQTLRQRNSPIVAEHLQQIDDHQTDELRLATSFPERASDDEVIAAISHADPVVAHAAIHAAAVRKLDRHLFSALDEGQGHPSGPLRALQLLHTPGVVGGLIDRLGKTSNSELRRGILAALCRLHFQEGAWKGDSWGTRPDTRGPYYQPEPWDETERIAAVLKQALESSSPDEAAFLIQVMRLNRIQSDDALARVLALAQRDPNLIPDAVTQLATSDAVPAAATPMLIDALQSDAPISLLSNAIIALAKTDSTDGCAASLMALPQMETQIEQLEAAVREAKKIEDPNVAKHEKKNASTRVAEARSQFEAAWNAFLAAPQLENHHQLLEREAEKTGTRASLWADAALLKLSARKSGSPESREMTTKALDSGWQAHAARRIQILEAASAIKHRELADKILLALDDPDAAVRQTAKATAKKLGIKKVVDETPKIATLTPAEALAAVLKTQGDLATGEQIFTKATCIACHTTQESEPQKGPYLGNIAQTYKRPELAQNILDPNKTIAQGFASELITLKDGTQQMGFITLEGATEVKLRNVAAQEFTLKTADIQERQKLPTSMMPPGLMLNFTVHEFASLLDYLIHLSQK